MVPRDGPGSRCGSSEGSRTHSRLIRIRCQLEQEQRGEPILLYGCEEGLNLICDHSDHVLRRAKLVKLNGLRQAGAVRTVPYRCIWLLAKLKRRSRES